MKKFLLSLMLLLFMVSLIVSCGEKADTPADNAPSGEPEEVADTTRLDSAAAEATEADTTRLDSAAAEATETDTADTMMTMEGEGWGQ